MLTSILAFALALPQISLDADASVEKFALGRTAGVGTSDDGRPLAVGPTWLATFDARGATFVPALGSRAPQRQDLGLAAVLVTRGEVSIPLASSEPRTRGDAVVYERAPGIEERFEATLAGLEHSVLITGPVGTSGDLVVRVALDGEVAGSGTRRTDGTHRFGREHGGVGYGQLFGVDANGARCDGDVRLVAGGFELVLPASFVDDAAWPILLDPAVGALFDVSSPQPGSPTFLEFDTDPAVAYDESTNTYMAVWERRYAANANVRVHYQRFDATGAPVGSQLLISSNTTGHDPRVVSLNGTDRFLVTWVEQNSGVWQVRARTATALPGQLSNTIVLAESTTGTILHDLAGESVGAGNVKARGFCVWSHPTQGLQLTRVLAPPSSDIFVEGTTQIAPDPGVFESIGEPRIARSTSANGRLAVAWVRRNSLADTNRVYSTVVDRTGAVLHTPQLVSGAETEVVHLDVDGGGADPARYVVVWTADDVPTLPGGGRLSTVALTSANALVAQAPVTLQTNINSYYDSVSVGWRSGIALAVYHDGASVIEQRIDQLTGQAIGAKSVAIPYDFTGPTLLYAFTEAEICMNASGGNALTSVGVVVATRVTLDQNNPGPDIAHTITGRFVSAFSPQASVAFLSSGCGAVGTISIPQPPASGNATFSIDVLASPSALFGVLNIAAPQLLLDCGACQFVPPGTTYLVPITSPLTSQALPIPASSALAGAQVLAQWYLYAPGASPCSFVPDFGATGVVQLTVN